MKSKLFLLSVVLFLSSIYSFSQTLGSSPLLQPTRLFNTDQNMKFGFNAGTSFSTFGNGFSLFSNHVSPYFSFQVSPKFSLEIGTSFSSYNSGNMPVLSLSGNPATNNFTGISGYATGRYRASEKLIISGSIYRESSIIPGLNVNPAAFEFLNQGMAVGFDYKINDKLSFGAGFQMMQVSNPWGMNYMQNSPFQNSRFGRNGIW